MTLKTKGKLYIDSWALSDNGLVRENNEDAWVAIPELDVYLVADGMGGHNAGEIAAVSCVEELAKILKKRLKRSLSLNLAEKLIAESIEEVNLAVHAKSHAKAEWQGMGCTLACLHFHPEGAIIGHVGDSRVYLFRSGKLFQLTRDDSLVMDLVDRGRMTQEEASLFGQKHIITKAIGTDPVLYPHVQVIEMEYGDQFMMCTDGLSDCVKREEIEAIMGRSLTLKDSVEHLIQRANLEGGHDNITIIQMSVSHAKLPLRNLSRP